MLAARRGAIRVVNQNVVVAGGADHAVNSFRELFMFRRKRVIGFRFIASHRHFASLRFMVSTMTAS